MDELSASGGVSLGTGVVSGCSSVVVVASDGVAGSGVIFAGGVWSVPVGISFMC